MIWAVLLAAFAIGAAVGGGGMNWYHEAANARHELAQKQAEEDWATFVETKEVEAQGWMAAAASAYVDGEAAGRKTAGRVSASTRAIVASGSGFQNPACTAGADGYALIVAALKGIRTGNVPETPVGTPAPVPATPVAAPPPIAAPAPSSRPPKPKPVR